MEPQQTERPWTSPGIPPWAAKHRAPWWHGIGERATAVALLILLDPTRAARFYRATTDARPRVYANRRTLHHPSRVLAVAFAASTVVVTYTTTVVVSLAWWPPTAITGYLLAGLAVAELGVLASVAAWARR